jgi:hypothetical protein
MSDILTEQEVFELTLKRRPSAQERVLIRLGIDCRKRPDGSLVVLRAHRDEVLGIRRPRSQTSEINWA